MSFDCGFAFFQLIKDWHFTLPLIIALALAVYNLIYESKLLGAIFIFLIVLFVGLNIYTTEIRQ